MSALALETRMTSWDCEAGQVDALVCQIEPVRTVSEPGPIRVLIAENDPGMRDDLRSLIQAERDTEIVGEVDSAKGAIDCVRSLMPDLVLLDIELPEMNGIDIVRNYGVDRSPITIFLAGDDHHAADAFQVNAFDYMVKPLTERRFHATLDRVRRHVRRQRFQELSARLAALSAEIRQLRSYQPLLRIRSRGQLLILKVEEIDWIEADAKYSNVHTNRATHRVRESISRIQAQLDPDRFVRVHRSAIVNLDRVLEVTSAAGSPGVILRDGTRVPVNRLQRHRLIGFADRRT